MELDPLHYLFVDDLKGLYHAERELGKLLPRLAQIVTSDVLRTTLENHIQESKEQVGRLDAIFKMIGQKPRGKKSKSIADLVNDGERLLNGHITGISRDAALIARAQQMEHFEIAEYGAIRTYAQLLGLDAAAELLTKTLAEETAAHKKLSALAHGIGES